LPTGDTTAYFPAGIGTPGSRHASSHAPETPLTSLCAAGTYSHAAKHITVTHIPLALVIMTSFLIDLLIGLRITDEQGQYCVVVHKIFRTMPKVWHEILIWDKTNEWIC
jgi:hypothetical protein